MIRGHENKNGALKGVKCTYYLTFYLLDLMTIFDYLYETFLLVHNLNVQMTDGRKSLVVVLPTYIVQTPT